MNKMMVPQVKDASYGRTPPRPFTPFKLPELHPEHDRKRPEMPWALRTRANERQAGHSPPSGNDILLITDVGTGKESRGLNGPEEQERTMHR